HVPGGRGAALRAEAAVEAEILVLEHEPGRLREGPRGEQGLVGVERRNGETQTDLIVLAVGRDREAVHRTDVHARVTLDAELVGEVRLDVAVEEARGFPQGLRGVEAELHLDLERGEPLLQLPVPRLSTPRGII